ncbi:hypothetical protein H8B02_11705 [Bradyrhizobium sp. Pear77]|uniref:hypothetical protein n=1 Tax=Bradyrhizobium altum TaxID=1571202 RepID=UPI001E2BD000|nr:hypothetical protein [Bradyrhizobium altum]MCC8954101.1 hypothetical protein [Bradyrhizobium altum]
MTIFQMRLPSELSEAISAAARARRMTASAWLRQAAVTMATLEGTFRSEPPRRRRFVGVTCLEDGTPIDVQDFDEDNLPPIIKAYVESNDAMDEGTLPAAPSRSAGELSDRDENGHQRWALIEDDQIKAIGGYLAAKPDDRMWVPVVHEDSEPFDAATHWRLKPHYTLVDVYGTPDRVICTYPVVLKSMEHA